MADIETTLKTRTNQDNVYPNIKSNNIPSGAVTTVKIADGAVTSAKIADGGVTAAKIGSGAVQHSNLGSRVVDTDNLADRSVSQDKLINGSVGNDQLISESITGDKIAERTITGDRIAYNTITRDRFKYGRMTLHDMYATSSGGDFINFIHGIESLLGMPGAKFYYQYKPDAHTVYNITPLYIYACTENSTTPNMGIKFVFTLPDGTNKTIQWLLSDSSTEPAELADIVCEYFGL